jgi:thiamine pyrophosphokinase
MENKPERGILFANGEMVNPDIISDYVRPGDFLIAVDGGLKHLTALNLQPDLIIGDLDSADSAAVERFKQSGVRVSQFPVEKDETDLELAFTAALEMGLTSLILVAALGGRLDQTLANIFLLTRPQLADCDVRLVDHEQEVFIIRKKAVLQGRKGQRVSLLPLNGTAAGVHTRGLTFPLNNETLFPYESRGISNRMEDSQAEISLEKGTLLCIHEMQPSTIKE